MKLEMTKVRRYSRGVRNTKKVIDPAYSLQIKSDNKTNWLLPTFLELEKKGAFTRMTRAGVPASKVFKFFNELGLIVLRYRLSAKFSINTAREEKDDSAIYRAAIKLEELVINRIVSLEAESAKFCAVVDGKYSKDSFEYALKFEVVRQIDERIAPHRKFQSALKELDLAMYSELLARNIAALRHHGEYNPTRKGIRAKRDEAAIKAVKVAKILEIESPLAFVSDVFRCYQIVEFFKGAPQLTNKALFTKVERIQSKKRNWA